MSNIIQSVVDAINATGYEAFNEYPGCVHVPLDECSGFWSGTANATWTVDLQTHDGECLASYDTGISTDSSDAANIAAAILAIVTAYDERRTL